jgi:hypothetical protein
MNLRIFNGWHNQLSNSKGGLMRSFLFASALLINAFVGAQTQSDCTLDPDQGKKKVVLKNHVEAEMEWSACTSIGRNLTFSLPLSEAVSSSSDVLKRAAKLIREWESTTSLPVSLMVGEVSSVLEMRAKEEPAYVFGENIPVGEINREVPGYDGVTVKVTTKDKKQYLKVSYWANP